MKRVLALNPSTAKQRRLLANANAAIASLHDMIINDEYNERKENALMDEAERASNEATSSAASNSNYHYDNSCKMFDAVCSKICSR